MILYYIILYYILLSYIILYYIILYYIILYYIILFYLDPLGHEFVGQAACGPAPGRVFAGKVGSSLARGVQPGCFAWSMLSSL